MKEYLQIIDKIQRQRQDTIKKEKDCWRRLSCVGGDLCTWQSPPENLHIQLALSLNTNTNTDTNTKEKKTTTSPRSNSPGGLAGTVQHG